MSEMNPADRRKATRVDFSHEFPARMIAIDGTWHRPCKIFDVSETGAKLQVDGSIAKLQLKEFFLLLSSTGTAHRRCELAWVNGDEVGARFVQTPTKRSAPKSSSRPLA